MNRADMETLVLEILAEVLLPDRGRISVSSRDRLVDLGVDSLCYLSFWTTFERRRGYRVDDEDILGDMRTVLDLVERAQQVESARARH